MTTLRKAATGLCVLLCLVAAHRAVAQATFVPLPKPMRLTAPVRPAKGGVAVYIVKLKEYIWHVVEMLSARAAP